MDCSTAIKTESESKAEKLITNKNVTENSGENKGLAALKEGQQITAVVVAVDEQVTLDFDGQKITASKSVLNHAKPGDIKTFEVVHTSDREIELRVVEDVSGGREKTFKAATINNLDWATVLSQKEQAARNSDREANLRSDRQSFEEIISKLTERDYKLLEEEGFPIENFTVKGLSEALSRIKGEKTDFNHKKSGKTDSFDKAALAKRLKEENLPDTMQNQERLSKALELCGSIFSMNDSAMQNLISADAEPTAENIYKACYSASSGRNSENRRLTDKAWNELLGQVKEVIQTAGYEVNEDSLSDARWLIENRLPLTADTLAYKNNLEKLKSDADKDILLDTVIKGMREGLNPIEVPLTVKEDKSPEQIINDIHSVSGESISQAVREDTELTIRNLITIQKHLSRGKEETIKETAAKEAAGQEADTKEAEATETDRSEVPSDSEEKAYEYREIKAKRQLEELRLKMTLEAAGQLRKKGISVETERLGKVVEELRKLEEDYYKSMLREADAKVDESSLNILKETSQSIEKLKNIPCSILGSTLPIRENQTITGLLTEGGKLQSEYTKAGMAYEMLATVPNSEYGDSIKKAFANSDYLLSQMGLDNTRENSRAVRILGYNRMEITEEAVSQVKAYDEQVTSLLHNLHPAVTVRLIKEGINPLNMPVNELNNVIDRMKEEQGINSEERFSTYLRSLDKENGISTEERKAYIGIYRLLYQIDKSDGAALGAVIRTDREVTLGSLLSAVQTSGRGGIDAAVDNEFGSLQGIPHNRETIREQLGIFSGINSNASGQTDTGQQAASQIQEEAGDKERTRYYSRILRHMKDELSPGKLKEAGSTAADTSGTDSLSPAAPLLSSDRGIWEKVKEVPVEKLLDRLYDAEPDIDPNGEAYKGRVQELRELYKNSEQSIRFLNDFRMPSTPLNIMLANHILSNGESPIKKPARHRDENIVENAENSLKETEDLSDKLIDKQTMLKEYEKIETDSKAFLSSACMTGTIDSRRLAELKSAGQQITFIRKLAEREFYQIPVVTDSTITNINLTILHGAEASGRVTVNVNSEKLGNIKAEFTLKEQAVKGFISSDSRSGLEQLQKHTDEMEEAAEEYEVMIKQLDFGLQRRNNEAYSYQKLNAEEEPASASNSTERILYRIAKATVQMVRRAENGMENSKKAVS